MSNFNIFDKKYLKLLLEPFVPGMADHVTPIKYEALNPDSFLLLFRTTSQKNNHHYFVSLETDSQDSIEGARCTIEDWHRNEVITFLPLKEVRSDKTTYGVTDYQAATSGPYFAMLAEVKRPTFKGYWADAIVISPGDTIGDKIKSYPREVQINIRKTLKEILQHTIDANASFLESLHAKKQDTMKDDVNQTDMVVSLYVQTNGNVEFFYNYSPKKSDNQKK